MHTREGKLNFRRRATEIPELQEPRTDSLIFSSGRTSQWPGTLKGPVRSEEERKNIESKAVEVAGGGNVDNELTVKPGKSNPKVKKHSTES